MTQELPTPQDQTVGFMQLARPILRAKIGCALYVLSIWPELPGVATINTLMWPYKQRYDAAQTNNDPGPWIEGPEDIRRHAAKVLSSALAELLQAAPLEVSEKIWKDQAEYLSFALGDGTPDDESPSSAVESPAPA